MLLVRINICFDNFITKEDITIDFLNNVKEIKNYIPKVHNLIKYILISLAPIIIVIFILTKIIGIQLITPIICVILSISNLIYLIHFFIM